MSAAIDTSRRTGLATIQRLALTKSDAAAALGISIDSFERHVQPELRVIRRGRMRLIPCRELERWTAENAALVLERTRP